MKYRPAFPAFSVCCLLCLLLASGCISRKAAVSKPDTVLLQQLFDKDPGPFQKIFQDPDRYRVQIIYTRIDRLRKNKPRFTDFYFNVKPSLYFYPASTVKMPVALLALQKINELKDPRLSRETALITESDQPWETPVYNDPQSETGKPSIAGYVRKIFLVSDDDAYNRLYEFCGQDYINRSLREMGYDSSEIIHRLSLPLNAEQNRISNPVRFLSDSGELIKEIPGIRSGWVRYLRNESLGEGYIRKGSVVREPFDFAGKNRLLLPDLHQILRAVIFPTSVPPKQQFRFGTGDRAFLLKYMSQYPGETRFPPYNNQEFWNTYVKFLLYGSEKDAPEIPGLRIFNKVGEAYGFLTDVAYIADLENKVEFMVSATIYCNSDGILNDNRYDYDTLGFPFLKHVGEVLYRYEKNRPRKRVADLSEFRIDYDKP